MRLLEITLGAIGLAMLAIFIVFCRDIRRVWREERWPKEQHPSYFRDLKRYGDDIR